MGNRSCANCGEFIGYVNYDTYRFCSNECRISFFKKFNKKVPEGIRQGHYPTKKQRESIE